MLVVGDHHYFFFNPFTLAEIPTQPYPRQPPEVADQVGEFSSAPTSRDCNIFLLSSHRNSLPVSRGSRAAFYLNF
ncbi:hypothetical protein AXF42_Ash021276 [Apostasia shenzhenica]|uniref:Uncharacterized protein n=1 Tax=Apostasia shenzhenica TaxID=1088818 RepID=A0A2I0AVU5_9ASPA|nr:hypothetical protein AXF42_Ash021276 [Apostasia shenzhenica]